MTIPEGVTSIGYRAFERCTKMASVTIPSSVASIDFLAFADCKAMADVYCYAETVPETLLFYERENIFEGTPIRYATLHVPASAIEAYRTKEPWSNFGRIVAINNEDAVTQVKAVPVLIQSEGNVLTVRNAPAGTPIHVYDLSGKLIGETMASAAATNVKTTGHDKVVIVRVGERSVKVRRN